MKKVFSFLKPYKLSIIVAYSFTFIELATELLLPFFLGLMINEGVIHKNLSNIIMWGSIMIGLSFLSFVSGILNSFYASHTSNSFAYDIRQKLFEKIQAFSFSNLDQYPTSGLMTRFTNDVRQVRDVIFMGLRIMTRAPMMIIGGVIMSFIVNVKLSFIFLITVPILVSFLFWVLKRASHLFEKVQGRIDTVNRIMQENLSGMRLIKAFVRRNHEEKRFTLANKELADTTRTTFRLVESSMPILLFVMNMSLIVILWFGHTQSLAGNIVVGDVVAIVNYALRIAMAISMLTFITMSFSRMKASSERLSEVLEVEVDLRDHEEADQTLSIREGEIQFRQVFYKYQKSKNDILQDLTFTIKPKERVAIIGSTGAGKTTLFQLIPRLYDVQKGSILIDKHLITEYTLDRLRGEIGYVPQSPLLFSGTIRENITWGKEDATEKEIIKAAKDAQIHQFIMSLPDQYDTLISQRGVNLSGGQKQRLSIARALVRKPKILMLDDSTSALDLATESNLLEAIQRYHCTTLLITQKISTAMKADRILLLHQGRILAFGTHKKLMKESDLYYKIVESQFGEELPYAYS